MEYTGLPCAVSLNHPHVQEVGTVLLFPSKDGRHKTKVTCVCQGHTALRGGSGLDPISEGPLLPGSTAQSCEAPAVPEKPLSSSSLFCTSFSFFPLLFMSCVSFFFKEGLSASRELLSGPFSSNSREFPPVMSREQPLWLDGLP